MIAVADYWLAAAGTFAVTLGSGLAVTFGVLAVIDYFDRRYPPR